MNQQSDQSVADYTKQFYQFLSRCNLRENDEQLVARYVSGLKSELKGELIMLSLSSLEEAYQMTLEAEKKLKWDSYRKPDSSKGEKDMVEKAVAQTSERPNRKREKTKIKEREFRSQSVFDVVKLGIHHFDTKSLLIQQVLVAPKDGAEKILNNKACCKTTTMVNWSKPPIYDEYPKDEGIALGELASVLPIHNTQQSSTWVSNKRKSNDSNWIDKSVYEQRTKLFETYGIIHRFECLFIMDSGSQGNYVSQQLVSFLNLPTEYLPKPYNVSWVNQGS
ncbi:hypothetical protein RHSIM_RhsimUnG0111900 [Rhododendron simsii]|uniref:Retrotransposon gag domain-containing protein n=1 Tax=Rhododendron simsii TaxID=118357 RepID=A0A834FUY0_RHOSS|nr:hypothetical protein RHSIM_RhsimUnG0111900 [Rhododendron simsii]